MRLALLLLCTLAFQLDAQTCVQPLVATAGSGYVVRADGDSLSYHTGWWTAASRALLAKVATPGRRITITERAEWRVECVPTTAVIVVPPPPSPPPPPPANDDVYFAADFRGCTAGPQVGAWVGINTGTGDSVRVTRTNPHPGDECSAEFTFAADPPTEAGDAFAEWRFRLTQPVTEGWMGWSVYWPGPNDGAKGTAPYVHRNAAGPDNNKMLRLWDEDYNAYHVKLGWSTLPTSTGGHSGLNTEYLYRLASGAGDATANIGPWTNVTSGRLGAWVRFQLHFRLADAGQTNGIIEHYVNGVRVGGWSDLPLRSLASSPKNYIRHGYLLGWSNSGYDQTTKIWIARVVIASTKALTD